MGQTIVTLLAKNAKMLHFFVDVLLKTLDYGVICSVAYSLTSA